MSAVSSFSTVGMAVSLSDFYDPSTQTKVPVTIYYDDEIAPTSDGISYFNITLVCCSAPFGTESTRHFQIETKSENLENTKYINSIKMLMRHCFLPSKHASKSKSKKQAKMPAVSGIKIAPIFTCPVFTATPRYNIPATGLVVPTLAAPREEKKS